MKQERSRFEGVTREADNLDDLQMGPRKTLPVVRRYAWLWRSWEGAPEGQVS
jgi:hypothetical protein